MRVYSFLLLAGISFLNLKSASALDIDEKLTLRFLKVSNSKKTVLINRGAEDGLGVGDHAKFFITSGVVARGVVEKVSPSRSIWSLYRVVDPAEITDEKVLNLKIASPVKITVDPSKSMKDEPIPGGTDSMSMSDSEDESSKATPASLNEADQSELESMGLEETATKAETKSKKHKSSKEISLSEEVPVHGNTSNSWELWGTLYVNSLSGTVTTTDTASSGNTAATSSSIDFSAGLEKYFLNSTNTLKDISFTAFVHKRSLENGQDIKVATDWFEYGGGVNYHFYNPPSSINRMISFVGINAGVGNSKVVDTVTNSGASIETSTKGTSTFISGALGSKYILSNGFGIRAVLDYYSSRETYSYPNDVEVKRTLAGPRVQVGVSYRF